ncbi:MAG: hypothetical protein ACLQPV_06665 [Vulcanimicrobiaceae bacterium]
MRIDRETKLILSEAAPSHGAAGASALARDILERWAARVQATRRRASVDRALSYLKSSGDWSDEPQDFFPDVK